jgi:K+-sensing histidine kinase KdpD
MGVRKGDVAAAFCVLAATILTFASAALLNGKAPILFFLVAVTVAAAREGMRSGLIATVLSLGAMFSLFRNSITVLMGEYSQLALFAVVGVASTLVMDRLHRTNAALIQARRETDAINEKLLDHAESMALANTTLAQHKEALALAYQQLRQVAELVALDMQIPLKSTPTPPRCWIQSAENHLVEYAGLTRRRFPATDDDLGFMQAGW